MVELRTCKKCGQEKPITDFLINKKSGNFLFTCLKCDKEYHKQFYEQQKARNANKVAEIDPNTTKTCIRCGIKKPISEFSFDKATGKFLNTCKTCKCLITKENYEKNKDRRKAYAKSYAVENQEKVRAYRKEYYDAHAEQAKEYSRQYGRDHQAEIRAKGKIYRQEHKDEIRERDKKYAETHKEQIVERRKIWAKEHAEQLAEYHKKYQIENAERISERRKEYSKKNRKRITEYYLNKRSNDPLFKLSTQVRGLIRISLKKKGYSKDTHTYEILGCDYETLLNHLKQTWLDNYGTEWDGEDYHIDHIIPLATAKTEQEVKDLCYYENLQMLKPKDNLVKNKYLDWEIQKEN